MSSSDEEEASVSSSNDDATPHTIHNPLPSKIVVTVGTYDGVLAGWELKDKSRNEKKLEISFATPVHGGSVRSLCLAAAANSQTTKSSATKTMPGSLLSTGYDEMLKTHDFHRRLTSSGEVRTPTDMGTPVCASFAPPQQTFNYMYQPTEASPSSTHCLVGFSSGKLVIYKKRDWSVQHVLAGHAGGVASLAVHPTGKIALTGGDSDGKLKLWDLTKGRLSFVTKIAPSSQLGRTRATSMDPVVCTVWSTDGTMYAYCHGNHITVRDVATGTDWCDVELPSRVNQVALMQGPEGIFVAAACNDGSLPVLAVKTGDDDNANDKEEGVARAIMAIEPIDGPVAGEERYKCIHTVCGYYVVTANSAGVVSLMNLEGAVRMIMTNEPDEEENPADGSDNDSDDDKINDSGDEDLAVDIIDAVQLGSGARVTCLAAWACDDDADQDTDEEDSVSDVEAQAQSTKRSAAPLEVDDNDKKRKLGNRQNLEMDPKEVEKARSLVAKAKKMQKKKDSKKRRKVSPGE